MNPSSRSGFTLIEVLIVSVLLFFLSMTLFQVVRQTVSAKEDIDQKTEILQGARAAFSLIERDIKAGYYVTPEDLGWSAQRPDSLSKDQQWVPPPRPLPVTIFQGRADEVFFSSRTHQRLAQDAPEDDEHFVTYQLHEKDLVRAESARAVSVADREDPSKFHQFTVLENVSSLKFSYYDNKNDKWLDAWDTEKAENKDRLPDAVKVELQYMPQDETGNRRRKVEAIKMSMMVRPADAIFKTPPAPAPQTAPGAIPGLPGANPSSSSSEAAGT